MEKISQLKNNIDFIYKNNKNTPRMAICFDFSLNKAETKTGIYTLIARLLVQGTKKYNSEELANEFEKYAIDFSCDMFPNYLRFRLVCLNEDFSKAVELFNEVITNSTFKEFEKEKSKLKMEISAELDSPKSIAMDNYSKTIFENHYYGTSGSLTEISKNIDNITPQEVIDTYNNILNNSYKSLAVVGALEENEVIPLLENTLGCIPSSKNNIIKIEKPAEILKHKDIIETKKDINQAHIVKGWQVATSDNKKEHATLILLNIILGACGLSSRLFLELRDKKGLAYVVRSMYDALKLMGSFMIYIATEPNNIEVSLKGFEEEMEKIKTIKVSEEELNDAKNNFIGKCAFLNETNIQQACVYAKNKVFGFDFHYAEQLKEEVKEITSDDILACAKKYFNDKYVISIIKP